MVNRGSATTTMAHSLDRPLSISWPWKPCLQLGPNLTNGANRECQQPSHMATGTRQLHFRYQDLDGVNRAFNFEFLPSELRLLLDSSNHLASPPKRFFCSGASYLRRYTPTVRVRERIRDRVLITR